MALCSKFGAAISKNDCRPTSPTPTAGYRSQKAIVFFHACVFCFGIFASFRVEHEYQIQYYLFIFPTSKVSHEKTVLQLFQELPFDDLFADSSDLKDALAYCRGSKRLQIPSAEWRAALPTVL